jgi:hypothetical protein
MNSHRAFVAPSDQSGYCGEYGRFSGAMAFVGQSA